MKNFLIFLSVSILFFRVSSLVVFAAISTPTPTPNSLDAQISNLKDKIASRVAQLKLVDKRGIIGIVTDVSQTQITITDLSGNTRFIDVDELTKFTSPSVKTSFGISDITKGAKIGVLGLYNKESRRILARFVDVLITPVFLTGGISNLDKTNYTITLLTESKNSFVVDIEDSTKTYSYDVTAGLTKAGFSKILEAERVSVIGFLDIKNPKHIIASRIILFPLLPLSPKITIFKPTQLDLQGTIVPSTGSGHKLTPLGK